MTVNRKKRGRPNLNQPLLSAESIMEQSKSLLHDTGTIPSIRSIARELNVDPMAIYHYFPNKSALLEAVTTSLLETLYEPTGECEWHDELELLCASYLSLLGNYANLLETMLSMKTAGPTVVFTKRYQQIIAPLNLADQVRKDTLDFLVDYLHGFALARRCNQTDQPLKQDMTKGPLALLFQILQTHDQRPRSTGSERFSRHPSNYPE